MATKTMSISLAPFEKDSQVKKADFWKQEFKCSRHHPPKIWTQFETHKSVQPLRLKLTFPEPQYCGAHHGDLCCGGLHNHGAKNLF
jgi:hypothetical protein